MALQILGTSLEKGVIFKEICNNFSIVRAQITLPLLLLKIWADSSKSNTYSPQCDQVHTVALINFSALLPEVQYQ